MRTEEKVRHKSKRKTRQWGRENGPGYLKMKRAAPRAQAQELQTATVKKPRSGLKCALNKLSGGSERQMKEDTRTGRAGVTHRGR